MTSIAEHRNVSLEQAILLHPENSLGASIVLWERLALILFPLIGKRNFECLFSRSLYLTQLRYDWITRSRANHGGESEYANLRICLDGDGIEGRSLASVSLLNTFIDTLVGLLGERLTEHVLNHAWTELKPV